MATITRTIDIDGATVELRAFVSQAADGWLWVARAEDAGVAYARSGHRAWHRADAALDEAERAVRRDLGN